MSTRRRRHGTLRPLLAWAGVLAAMVVIFILSSSPDFGSFGSGRLRIDPSLLGHLAAFGGLGVLVAHALDATGTRRRLWWTFVICVLYAIVDEAHQNWVPGRTPSATDLGVDALGAVAGFWIWSRLLHPGIVMRIRRRRTGRPAGPRQVKPLQTPRGAHAQPSAEPIRLDEERQT